jgi:serine/threonine protein phosphatase 1
MDRRENVFAVSDLHGNSKGLFQAIKRSGFNHRKDKLFFLGDFCDGYDGQVEIIEYFLSLKNFIPLFGNHDLFLKNFIESGIINEKWRRIPSYFNTIELFRDKHEILKEYFLKCKHFVIDDNRLFCHAGFNHRRSLNKQRLLNFSINRTLWKVAKQYEKQKIRFRIPDEKIMNIIIGHNPTKSKMPEKRANVLNIDTGAGNGGKVTLYNLTNNSYVQSDFSKSLYRKH